eukprot:COSAG03_NODE_255_length_9849_cov_16.261846_1_plen_47_part_00
MPQNHAFVNDEFGPLVGLLTSLQSMLGTFHMSDFFQAEDGIRDTNS